MNKVWIGVFILTATCSVCGFVTGDTVGGIVLIGVCLLIIFLDWCGRSGPEGPERDVLEEVDEKLEELRETRNESEEKILRYMEDQQEAMVESQRRASLIWDGIIDHDIRDIWKDRAAGSFRYADMLELQNARNIHEIKIMLKEAIG